MIESTLHSLETIKEHVDESFETIKEHAEEAIESMKEHAEEAFETIAETFEPAFEGFSPYGSLAIDPLDEESESSSEGDVYEEDELEPVHENGKDEEVPDDDDHKTVETKSHKLKALGTMQLAVIVFYSVSGGPFGIEEAVRAGGAFYTLLGLAVLPFVWSIPEALVTAELGAAYPEASGGVAWVEEAFGLKTGWITGYLTWIAGVTDNAIYPALLLHYVTQLMPGVDMDTMNFALRFLLVSSLAVALGYVNYSGLPVVGELSVSICFLSMSPFFIFCICSIPKIDPQRWFQMPEPIVQWDDDNPTSGFLSSMAFGGVLWRPFLNNMFWNLNSFNSAGSFAGEVQDPGTVFPKAMFWSILFVILGYFVPMFFVLGASDAHQSEWVDGYLATAAFEVVGPWLGAWTVFAAGISNVALFQAEMSSDAFQLMGMADRGYVPKVLGTRSIYGTPTYAILLGTLIIVVVSVFDFSALIEMLNFNYSIALLLEYCAFLKLRISKPDIPRPYAIPLSTFWCCVVLIPTFLLTILTMALATKATFVFSFIAVIVGLVMYVIGNGRGYNSSHVGSNGVELHDDGAVPTERTKLVQQ